MSFIVEKGLFVSKQARPDIQPPIGVLCTRVEAPNVSDWNKLIRLLKCLNSTRDDVLTLGANDLHVIKWYIDAMFAVHPGIKSYAGGTMSFGHGAVQSLFMKLNWLELLMELLQCCGLSCLWRHKVT